MRILPSLEHPGSTHHEQLLAKTIQLLEQRITDKTSILNMHQVLTLASSLAHFNFKRESREMVASYGRLLSSSFARCLNDGITNPLAFGLKFYSLVRQHSNFTSALLQPVRDAVLAKAVHEHLDRLDGVEQLRFVLLVIDQMATLSMHGKSQTNEAALLKLASSLPPQIILSKKDKWLALQLYFMDILPTLRQTDGKVELGANIHFLSSQLNKEIEESVNNSQSLLKFQNLTSILVCHLLDSGDKAWIAKIGATLSQVSAVELNNMFRKISNISTLLLVQYPDLVRSPKDLVAGVFELVLANATRVMTDTGVAVKLLEFACAVDEALLLDEKGKLTPTFRKILSLFAAADQTFLEKVAAAMSLNDVRRLAFRSSALDFADFAFIQRLAAFKIADLLRRDLDFAQVLNCFELLHHYDESWCRDFLAYPEVSTFVSRLSFSLKAGKHQSSNSLIKILKLLIFLRKHSKTQQELDSLADYSMKIGSIIRRHQQKEKKQEDIIESEKIVAMLENAKTLAIKQLAGTFNAASFHNVVLTANLLAVLLEYHLKVAPLSEGDCKIFQEKFEVGSTHQACIDDLSPSQTQAFVAKIARNRRLMSKDDGLVK